MINMASATGLPRRVESARNALITYIHDRQLKTGDRLPAYASLRAEFGFGSQTIAAAVESLCRLGVLEVRDKVGLFVADPDAGHLTGRTIAVAVRPLSGSAYAATLAGFIQKLLTERNCRCVTFYQSSDPLDSPAPELDEFPGFEQSLSENGCDGIITLCPLAPAAQAKLAELHLPCCFIGDDDAVTMPISVVIEVNRFIQEAISALKKSDCSNIVQICTSQEQLKLRRQANIDSLIGVSYDGGAAIAEQLLAMPPSSRPDGIVCDDDTVISGLLAQLIARQLPDIAYLPRIATIIHGELQERYPSDKMILFRQDIEEYATLAVDLLLNIVRGAAPKELQLSYRFIPVS